MTTNAQAQSSAQSPIQTSAKPSGKPGHSTVGNPLGIAPWLFLALGWLIPGAGHFLLRKWVRGTLIFVSILAMFLIGMSLKGKVYQPTTSDPLEMLGFIGDLGSGLPYLITHFFDLGQSVVKTAVADYGSKFIVAAGLLNLIAAVDAHSLATGRKQA